MLVATVLTCHLVGPFWARRLEGLPPLRVWLALLLLGVGAFVGGRFHFALNYPRMGASSLVDLLEFWRGNLHAAGAAIGIVLALPVSVWLLKLPLGKLMDGLVPTIGVGIALARFGCFLHGCCYGVVCSGPTCIRLGPKSGVFHEQVRQGVLDFGATHTLAVHPLPLYFAAVGLLITAFGLWYRRRRDYEGQVALVALVIFAASSAMLEFLRADFEGRVYWNDLPQLAWIAFGLTAASLILLLSADLAHHVRVKRSASAVATKTAVLLFVLGYSGEGLAWLEPLALAEPPRAMVGESQPARGDAPANEVPPSDDHPVADSAGGEGEATPGKIVRLELTPLGLSATVERVTTRDLLARLLGVLPIEIGGTPDFDEIVSADFQDQPVEDALKRLFPGWSTAVYYRGAEVARVRLLPRAGADPSGQDVPLPGATSSEGVGSSEGEQEKMAARQRELARRRAQQRDSVRLPRSLAKELGSRRKSFWELMGVGFRHHDPQVRASALEVSAAHLGNRPELLDGLREVAAGMDDESIAALVSSEAGSNSRPLLEAILPHLSLKERDRVEGIMEQWIE